MCIQIRNCLFLMDLGTWQSSLLGTDLHLLLHEITKADVTQRAISGASGLPDIIHFTNSPFIVVSEHRVLAAEANPDLSFVPGSMCVCFTG